MQICCPGLLSVCIADKWSNKSKHNHYVIWILYLKIAADGLHIAFFLRLSPDDRNVMNDLHEPVFHLLSGRIRKQRYVLAHARRRRAFFKRPLLVFVFLRLGCRWTGQRRNQPRSSHLPDSPQKMRNRFLGKALSGGTIPALWHSEKIRTESARISRHGLRYTTVADYNLYFG